MTVQQLPETFNSLAGDPSTLEDRLQTVFDFLLALIPDLRGLLFVSTGSPNGAIVASPPALYLNLSGGAGTTLYVKESGSSTNTGWVGK